MKNLIRICILIIVAAVYSCDDPYKDETFAVYDMQPISSYLSTRPDDFSEWIKVMKYADMYNAVNQATAKLTLFAPTNQAMEAFYQEKKVSSVEELGKVYVRQLVQYHLVNDTITLEEFSKGGELEDKTLSNDILEVTFNADDSSEGGFNAMYMNGEAHVKELAIHTSNGFVYVLDDVMRPMVESVYQKLFENNKNNILAEALKRTGWHDTLNIIADTITMPDGTKLEVRRNYTILGVPDDVFQSKGISSCDDLVKKLGAGEDYENKNNALNRYAAYHILNGRYKVDNLKKFDVDTVATCKIWGTACENAAIKISQEADDNYYLNYDGGSEMRTVFRESDCDYQTKNGYIQQLEGLLPICKDLKPFIIYWDLADYPEVANYIGSNGVDGQIFQQEIDAKAEPSTELKDAKLACYEYKVGSQGMPVSNFGNLAYRTLRSNANYDNQDKTRRFLHGDLLTVSLGYKGWVQMKSPVMIPGKYKVTLRYFYANSMKNFRSYGSGSNGGQIDVEFPEMENVSSVSYPLYSSLPSDTDANGNYLVTMGLFDTVLYDVVEIPDMKEYTMRITLNDPAASISKDFRIQVDYILFEPIN